MILLTRTIINRLTRKEGGIGDREIKWEGLERERLEGEGLKDFLKYNS